MPGRFLFACLCLALAVFPAHARGPEGRYRLAGQPDEASEIVLRRDGWFVYFMAAGALDERAQGRWTRDGKRLRLVTEPRPVPPRFEPRPAERSEGTARAVMVSWPNGDGIAGVDLRVGFDTGDPTEVYTQEDGWTLPAGETRSPRWIELAVPMHGLASPRFPIDAPPGTRLRFTLVPNDLGVVDFSSIAVEDAGDRLLVHRGGSVLTYRRQ